MPQVTITTILTYKMTYLVDTKDAPAEYALDSITCNELEEWKQEAVDETIIGMQLGWVDTTIKHKDPKLNRDMINGATYTWNGDEFEQGLHLSELE